MNRSLANVLFGGISAPISADAHKIEGTITKTSVDDAVEALANADNVILCLPSFTICDTTS
jgi:H+-translocating NAD(P) transhydrogenase